VHRELGTDVPQGVDPRRSHDSRYRTERVTQSQVQQTTVEKSLEQTANVQLDRGAYQMGHPVVAQVGGLQHAVDRARGKHRADQQASKPALPLDPERRGRLPFDEQHVGPGHKEPAEAEDADKEDSVVSRRVPRQQQAERAQDGREQAGRDRRKCMPTRSPAKGQYPPALQNPGEHERDAGAQQERCRYHCSMLTLPRRKRPGPDWSPPSRLLL